MTTESTTPAGQACYISTAIPYVNATAHIGFAFELIVADAIARHRRQRGDDVRFQTGTDENSLKNVRVAEARGEPVAALVERNARAYRALREPLGLSFDDFVRTGADPRHRAGVERLWRACAASDDLYARDYEGLYCVGCEQFYDPRDLVDGRCPEHGTGPDRVCERNWFFRLSRYRDRIAELIVTRRLEIIPDTRRNEVLAFLERGLEDLSVSRSRERARGWGIPVPGDPSQIIYVWFDALANYVTAPGYADHTPDYHRYWARAGERIHVIGKGITRFHAVYWPAFALSAGLALPTRVLVHGYLTCDGEKIAKSAGNGIDPTLAAGHLGVDALRYYLLRHVRTTGDGDFSLARLELTHDTELADQLGNLLERVVALGLRFRGGRIERRADAAPVIPELIREVAALERRIDSAVDRFRLDEALGTILDVVALANRAVTGTRPWELARGQDPDRFEVVIAELLAALDAIGTALAPFLPATSAGIASRLGRRAGGRAYRLVPGAPLFPKRRGARDDTPPRER